MPDFTYESLYKGSGLVFGIDEAGRGPWCGPVVAACVCWPNQKIDPALAEQINDSKKLSAQKREKLFPLIMNSAYVGIGQASAQEIDEINILQATFLAMDRALQNAAKNGHTASFALIDGNRLPRWTLPCQALIKGDSLSLSIAAASIIAKVTRDHIMTELAKEYPEYAWDKNAGYGTTEHIAALKKYGITPHHRKSYRPIKELLEQKKEGE